MRWGLVGGDEAIGDIALEMVHVCDASNSGG